MLANRKETFCVHGRYIRNFWRFISGERKQCPERTGSQHVVIRCH